MQALESEFHSANDGSVTEKKKKSIPCQCFCRCTAATSMLFSLRRLCTFGEVSHAMILLIPFCILLHYFFMTWTKFNWKNLTFLERLYRLCGKVSATWTSWSVENFPITKLLWRSFLFNWILQHGTLMSFKPSEFILLCQDVERCIKL
jgi:hypothetical protein